LLELRQEDPGKYELDLSRITRRQFLKYLVLAGALSGAAGLAGCATRSNDPCPPGVKGVTCSDLGEGSVVTPTAAGQQDHPIIWYVDLEHERVVNDPAQSADHLRTRNHRAAVLGWIANMFCQAIHYTEVGLSLARSEGVRAMFGGTCGALRKLKPGEEDPAEWAPGWYKEVGYMPVRVLQDDPIFAGLGSEPVFFESHYWEVKQLPADFELLASTDECEVQVMRHKDCLVYGTQFHPEVYEAGYSDGPTLLANFFDMAGVLR